MTTFQAGEDQANRRRYRRTLTDAWGKSEQAAFIKRTMGDVVLGFCRMEVEDMAAKRALDMRGAIVLTKDQIGVCGQRAVSSARVAAYGPWALTATDGGERWKREYAAARAIVLSGAMPPRLGDAVTEVE